MSPDPAKLSPEDSFRSSLEDVLTITEKLAFLCQNMDELNGMLKLALDNDAQLRLLMQQVLDQPKKR